MIAMPNNAGPGAEIQIRAQCLHGIDDSVNANAFMGTAVGRHIASATRPKAKPGKCQWRERDLQRAIAVARRSKLLNYRVELAPDGTISIVVGA